MLDQRARQIFRTLEPIMMEIEELDSMQESEHLKKIEDIRIVETTKKRNGKASPTLDDIVTYLQHRFQFLERIAPDTTPTSLPVTSQRVIAQASTAAPEKTGDVLNL
ncbi:unnamed protein product [Parnassius apollo]|uniref:(apollo) hypothetical protein n=1 Tax=Parnassius apollo TaxID=110799 RepID=A0A8S3YAQ0_PARAO|nr:unnamed protein product [Parnassius apollo]